MTAVKEYGQFCALARALDQVGDRWTLLVVRELLLGPASYSELQRHLPGVASNLLADRLRALQSGGIVARVHPDQARSPYRLTPRGKGLRAVVLELIRWGGPLMLTGPGHDVVDDRWAALGLDAMLSTSAYDGPAGRVRVACGNVVLDVVGEHGARRVEQVASGDQLQVDCEVSGALPAVLATAHSGRLDTGLRVRGSRTLARGLLAS